MESNPVDTFTPLSRSDDGMYQLLDLYRRQVLAGQREVIRAIGLQLGVEEEGAAYGLVDVWKGKLCQDEDPGYPGPEVDRLMEKLAELGGIWADLEERLRDRRFDLEDLNTLHHAIWKGIQNLKEPGTFEKN